MISVSATSYLNWTIKNRRHYTIGWRWKANQKATIVSSTKAPVAHIIRLELRSKPCSIIQDARIEYCNIKNSFVEMRTNPRWSGNSLSLKYEAAPVRIMLLMVDITPHVARTCIQVSEILRSGFGPWEYPSAKMCRAIRNEGILSAMAETKTIMPWVQTTQKDEQAITYLGFNYLPRGSTSWRSNQ